MHKSHDIRADGRHEHGGHDALLGSSVGVDGLLDGDEGTGSRHDVAESEGAHSKIKYHYRVLN